jgi:hypothetical protein
VGATEPTLGVVGRPRLRSGIRAYRLARAFTQKAVEPRADLCKEDEQLEKGGAMRARFVGMAVVLSVGLLAASASAKTYNAAKEFSESKGNPHGAWSYGYEGKLFGEEETAPAGVCGNPDLKGYWTHLPQPESASIVANRTKGVLDCTTNSITVQPDYINLDPEGLSFVKVVWTAPSSGTWKIEGNFAGDDPGEQAHTVEVLNGVDALYSATIDTYPQTDAFKLTVQLTAGEDLSFVSDTGASYTYLSTGLQVAIKPGKAKK